MPITNNLGQTKVGIRTGVLAQQVNYLLDSYSGASAAYSLRKLNGSYTGPAIRVRRSNDNTTLDVGFDASGNLDTTSLLSFVGGVNQIQYSEEFDNAYWGKVGVTVTANNTIAPDGTMTADLITETVSNSYHVFGRIGASGTWASGTSYNTSVYIKRTTDVNSPTRVALAFDYGSVSQKPYVIFNIENGTVESYNFFTDINTGYSITDSGNGWWRISMWGTLTVSRSSFESGGLIRFNNNLSTISTTQYTPLSGSGVYLWGYQLTRLGTDLQPYSKTTTTTAGNGFVSIWYDQSGNDLSLYQVTSSKQPQIVSNGSIFKSSGKPSVLFNGTTSEFTPQLISLSSNNCTLFSVFEIASTYLTNVEYPLFGLTNWYGIKFGVTNNKYFMIDKPTSDSVSLLSTNNISTGPKVGTTLFSSTTDKFRVNGSEVISGNAGTYGGAGSFYLGRSYLSKFWFGNISEMVIYNSNQTTNFTLIESNVNSYYSIY